MARSRPSKVKRPPPGPDGNKRLSGLRLPRRVVVEDQRRRIADSLARVVVCRGYEAATVLEISASAAVSRRTFYDFYGDKADAFCAVHGDALTLLGERVDRACEGEREWPAGVAAAIGAALRWAAMEPDRASLLVAEPFTAGPRSGYCHELLVARFAPPLRGRREYAKTACTRMDGLEELIVGGLAGVVAARLRADRAAELPAIASQLTHFVLSPYLGREEAGRVAARGVP